MLECVRFLVLLKLRIGFVKSVFIFLECWFIESGVFVVDRLMYVINGISIFRLERSFWDFLICFCLFVRKCLFFVEFIDKNIIFVFMFYIVKYVLISLDNFFNRFYVKIFFIC